jgi:hypothetical protein
MTMPKAKMKEVIRRAEIALVSTPMGEVIDMDRLLFEPTYGKMNEEQMKVIQGAVKDKTVFDLGAGDYTNSLILRGLGASRIVAIDKEFFGPTNRPTKGVTQYQMTFKAFLHVQRTKLQKVDFPKRGDVAFLSWPANYEMKGLLDLLSWFDTIIYLGKNTDSTACAWPEFFRVMQKRPVLSYVPHRRNTLIHYGATDRKLERGMKGEELAGMDDITSYTFQEAEDRA